MNERGPIKSVALCSLTVLAAVGFILFSSAAQSAREYLYQFDSHDLAANTFAGWSIRTDQQFSGGRAYVRNDATGLTHDLRPKMMQKVDPADRFTTMTVVDELFAPSKTTGGSLILNQTPASANAGPGIWMWLGNRSLPLDLPSVNADTDRLSMYCNFDVSIKQRDGFLQIPKISDSYPVNELGTFLDGNGDGKEGPGNAHYYHQVYPVGGAWLHIEFDKHPSHLRNSDGQASPANDPHNTAGIVPNTGGATSAGYAPLSYWESIVQMYWQINFEEGTSFFFDEVYLYSTSDAAESAEPNQNDDSISSVWVGFWPDEQKWRVGFVDESTLYGIGRRDDTTNSTYEMRWSTSPITNANFNVATPIIAEIFNDSLGPGQFRKRSPSFAWLRTRFTLGTPPLAPSVTKVYFAIRDISAIGQHVGPYPTNLGDGRNAPTTKVKLIDYDLVRASPKAPTNLRTVSP